MLVSKRFWGMILVSSMIALTANALSLSHYAKQSKLATGKWVKIAIPTDGVYEITDSELLEMGFSDPSKVQVYGCGGHVISEVLDGSAPDDLKKINTARYNGKLCFYGQGPTTMTLTDPRSKPYYTRQLNTYSTKGYYFLTESTTTRNVEVQGPALVPGTTARSTSLDYFMHENEMFSIGYSGKTLLGENLGSEGATFDYSLDGLASNSLTVCASVAANATGTAYAEATVINSTKSYPVGFTLSQSKMLAPADTREYYKQVAPSAKVTTDEIEPQGKLKININCPLGTVNTGRLDYFIITYEKNNVILDGHDSQTAMGFAQMNSEDRIQLPGATASTVLWCVDEPDAPVSYTLEPMVDEETEAITGYECSPRYSNKAAQFVAFDPEGTLMKIAGYEQVENQNLHAMAVPDMLIITNKFFMAEAQRVANLHKTVDGLDVAVVDQEQIFNEFSSGTPDAMAYRMLCKMLYDRDMNKFKYLLLFGHGSYDNRGLVSVKENRILTYQSTNSDNQDYTYTSDDFFGLLDDGSGSQTRINNDILRLGVGRYPVANLDEAKADVDKLVKYVSAPDYGAWRNDALVISDKGDGDLHIFQAEGINNMIEQSNLNTNMNTNKVYLEMFQPTLNDASTYTDARNRLIEYWQKGQYFTTYIGHAGALAFTKSKLWTSTLSQNTKYPNLPIMTTACCEVARYDSDERGIAEYMFHAPQGGAIALLTSTRQTYSDQNNIMNESFIRGMFSYAATGEMPTLGNAYMKCKQNFGPTSYGNKLSYVLLGDPAIKINYPKPLFSFTSINGNSVDEETSIETSPLQTITITAQVNKADGSGVDTDFNGDATVTLYDTKRLLKHTVQSTNIQTIERDVFYPRDVLASVQGRVVNGEFTGSIIVPRFEKGQNEGALIRLYAHKDGSEEMVNGAFDNITITEFNEETAINDDAAPVIETMFLNEESTFASSNVVPANSTLYITASDDISINTQSSSIGNCMKLQLDGKTSFPLIKQNAVTGDEGRSLAISFPLEGMSDGIHTLTFTVFDVAGNSATRSITFIVAPTSNVELASIDDPALENVKFDIAETSLATTPELNIKVINAQGELVWNEKSSSFPLTWNLTDNEGNRVKAGLYKYFGTYNDGTVYGGTAINDFIVIDSVKSNK